MRLLRWALSCLCSFSDSQEISRLKKKLSKTQEELENAHRMRGWERFGLKVSEKRREEAVSEISERCSLLSESVNSTQKEILSLREDNKKLEESLAEAKSQLALNALEKELMADLFEKLRQKVRADIASVSDSYAHQRLEQLVDGIPAPGRSPG